MNGSSLPMHLDSPFAEYFPKGVPQPADRDVAIEQLLQTKDKVVGSVTFPPKAITDLRFRLIQLHEYLHAFVHPFREEILFSLKAYLAQTATEWGGGKPVAALMLLGEADKEPSGYKHFEDRGKQKIGYTAMSTGFAAYTVVLSQFEELFVEFLCSAAAGPAYWTTLLDFDSDCSHSSANQFRSQWNAFNRHLYDPHPPPAARLILVPQMFLQVFARKDGLSGLSPVEAQQLVERMRGHLQDYVLSRMPATNSSTVLIYENADGPEEVRAITLSFEAFVPLYYSTFRAYSSLLTQWLKVNHPLSVFRWWLFSTDYHRRIFDLSEQFAQGKAKPITEGYFFDSIVGAAAARLCYDRDPSVRSNSLQQEAKVFQEGVSKSVIPLLTQQ